MEMSIGNLSSEIAKLNAGSAFLDQTNLLHNLEDLRKKNIELENLIKDASELVTKKTIHLMLDYVIKLLLDKFIPTYMCFMMDKPRGATVSQFFYENLKLVNDKISFNSYTKLKESLNPQSKLISIEELKETGWHDEEIESMSPEGIIPLSGIGGVYGLVILGPKVIGNGYSAIELNYLKVIIHFLSISMQNGINHQTSITDSKTGLYNYEFFIKRLNEEIAYCNRYKTTSCVVMIDVDFFKKFNDSYGHLAGDVALETLANYLKLSMRAEDAVARFGGEEFCIIITNFTGQKALEIADRIRSGVEKMNIEYNGQNYKITISLGLRLINGSETLDAEKIMDDADKALYVSKRKGRNRCTLFRPGFLGKAMIARAIADNN